MSHQLEIWIRNGGFYSIFFFIKFIKLFIKIQVSTYVFRLEYDAASVGYNKTVDLYFPIIKYQTNIRKNSDSPCKRNSFNRATSRSSPRTPASCFRISSRIKSPKTDPSRNLFNKAKCPFNTLPPFYLYFTFQ